MRVLFAGLLLSLAACTTLLDDDNKQPIGVGDGECFVGGCSSQICSDSDDIISTCEWRDEYACYRTATCERQADGACGWTETAELQACLESN